MSNSIISNLITTNITQNGGIDRITATEVRSVLNAINSFIQDDVVYGASIPFDKMVSKMAPHTVTGAITFTKNITGAIAGAGTILELTANGANKPDFSDFNETSNSSGWVNTSGVVNLCVFLYTGTQYLVTIVQKKVLAQLSTPGSFTASVISSSEIDLSWADVANESGYTIYFNGINDFSTAGVLTTKAADVTTHAHTGLSAASTFYYWIVAIGDGVTYSDSNSATASATTSGSGTTLNAPTGVTLGTATSTTQPLTWTDTNSSPNENGYKVYRNTVNTFGTATLATTTAANATSYTVTGLTASTLYYYWVVAAGNGTTTFDSSASTVASGSTAAGSGYDTDADTYFTAVATAGVTLTTTQKDAYNAWVLAEKSAGRYSKYITIYPFMGATAATHAINAKLPGTYDITWTGSITHDANGVRCGGTVSDYGDFGVNPASHLTLNDVHFSVYINDDNLASAYDIGLYGSTSALTLARISGSAYTNIQALGDLTTAATDMLGMNIITRISSAGYSYVKAGTVNAKTNTSVANPTGFMTLGKNNGSGQVASTRRYAFVTIGSGLTDTEAQGLNTNTVTFETALGRN